MAWREKFSMVLVSAAAIALSPLAAPRPAVHAEPPSGNPTIDGRYEAEGPIGPGGFLIFDVLGRGGVPASGVGAVALNVTAVDASADTHLSVGVSSVGPTLQPTTSNLNVPAGVTVANMVIADVSASGLVQVYNNAGTVDVAIDVLGWFPIGSFHPVPQRRVLETRSGVSPTVDGLATGGGAFHGAMDLRIAGRNGVPPTGVGAVALNVTATEPTAASHVTIWPAGVEMPTASNLNMVPGQTVPNMVITSPGDGGRVQLSNNSGVTHAVVDVMGWFSPEVVHAFAPARLLDTRPGGSTIDGRQSGSGPVNGAIEVAVAGRGGVPSVGADAVILNVTAVSPTTSSFVTVWPSGADRPIASNLNLRPGVTTPNLVIAKLGRGGAIDLFNLAGTSDLVVDVAGWMPAGSFGGLTPARLVDTRVDPGSSARKRTFPTSSPGTFTGFPLWTEQPHFAPGTNDVGARFPPGRYVADVAGVGCRFARIGSDGMVIAHETRSFESRLVVDVRPGDRALFTSDACGVIRGPQRSNVFVPSTVIFALPVGDNIVGVDVGPGEYVADGPGSGCVWGRLSGFGGEVSDIIEGAVESTGEPVHVTIRPTDAGFFSSPECGQFRPVHSPLGLPPFAVVPLPPL